MARGPVTVRGSGSFPVHGFGVGLVVAGPVEVGLPVVLAGRAGLLGPVIVSRVQQPVVGLGARGAGSAAVAVSSCRGRRNKCIVRRRRRRRERGVLKKRRRKKRKGRMASKRGRVEEEEEEEVKKKKKKKKKRRRSRKRRRDGEKEVEGG